ncbi:MAG: hypothetical protein Q8R00_01225 [Candidatus Nanoarchaeia archaeon]|nr:hypothetical protein [Candidatus Nanoarchaeia archaeon]
METKQKLKNIKDLEFNQILNLKNIFMVLVGGAIVTITLSKNLLNKAGVISFLTLFMILGFFQFNRKLDNIKEEIRSL